MYLPKKIILTAGIGEGETELNAFDNALLNAGVANYNFLKVSSIIPPKAKIINLSQSNSKKLLPKIGSIVPAVYSCAYGKRIGQKIVATLALGIPKNFDVNNGVIVEFNGENINKDKAEKIAQEILKNAFQVRNLTIDKIQLITAECKVKKKYTCAIALALMI